MFSRIKTMWTAAQRVEELENCLVPLIEEVRKINARLAGIARVHELEGRIALCLNQIKDMRNFFAQANGLNDRIAEAALLLKRLEMQTKAGGADARIK